MKFDDLYQRASGLSEIDQTDPLKYVSERRSIVGEAIARLASDANQAIPSIANLQCEIDTMRAINTSQTDRAQMLLGMLEQRVTALESIALALRNKISTNS